MSKVLEAKLPCPVCPSSDAYHLYDDGHGFCYSCEYLYLPNRINDLEDYTYEYLPWRGIHSDTFKLYGVQTKVAEDGKPVSVGFSYPSGGTKVRTLDKKDFFWNGDVKPGLFGVDKFAAGSHKSITITEGELDALSLYQVTKTPVVSVQGASSAVRDCTADFSYLSSFERIYLAFDSDGPGREAASRVAKLFEFGKVFDVRFSNRKDANEFLQLGEDRDLLNVWSNAKPYVPDEIVFTFDSFKKILKEPSKVGIPWSFPSLTKMTYGLRTGEVVLLKAPEKVGKTSLMHEFLRNILKRTSDNVAAIFLEEPRHRLLQSLAGLELRRPVHLPDSGVSDDDCFDSIKSLVGRDERLHLYNHFGFTDPDVFVDMVRFLVAGRMCKYVLFDHISIACSGLTGDNERRALEYLATKLEMLVKELDFSLIMVSHVNDVGQTRGSHYLTKLADITISAERDTNSLDELVRKTIKLSVPFNRFCASSGYCCDVVFDDLTYTLSENEGANDNARPTDTQGKVSEYSLAA